MSVEKSQLKMMITNSIGADIEDHVDGSRKTAHELNGAAQALKQAAKKVPADLVAHVERALVSGEIEDGLDSKLVAQLVKKYLARVGDFLNHLGDVEQQKAVAQFGRVSGMEDAMKLIQKMRDSESAKLQRLTELAQSDEIVLPMPSVRTAASAAKEAHGDLVVRRATKEAAGKKGKRAKVPVKKTNHGKRKKV